MTIQNQFRNEAENLIAVSFLSKKGLRYAIIQNEQVINIISCNVFKNEGYKQTILTYEVEQLQTLLFSYHNERNKELQLKELTANLERYKMPLKDENEKVTKCPKEILKKIKRFKDVTFFEGTINSHNWKGTPRYLTPYIDVFTGLFIKFSDGSFNFVTVKNSNIYSNEVISSRKRNYNTDLKEISNKEFSLKLQKEYKKVATEQLQEANKKFNQEKITFCCKYVENL